MSKWELVKFSEIMESLKNGIYKPKEYQGSGTKVVHMGDLFSNERIEQPDMKRYELNENELKKHLIEDGDLLFSRTSLKADGVGKCSIVIGDGEERVFESNIIRVRPLKSKVNPFYLFYLFKSNFGRVIMKAIIRQTAVAVITGSDLKEVIIPLPPKDIQNKIVNILKSIDDKIELNNQINYTLEKMAMTIYKQWFIDFGPFQKGEYKESELGMIPNGWDVVKLKEVAAVNKRNIKNDYPFENIRYIDISSVYKGKLEGYSKYNLSDAPSRAKRLVNNGDIIWSTVRPNRKSFLYIYNPYPNTVVSTGFAVLTPIKIPSVFLYLHVITNKFVSYLVNNAKGSAYPAVNASTFKDAKLCLPPKEVLNQFNDLVFPLINLKNENEMENVKLELMRDYLLPKLLSGEIDLSEAKECIENAML